MAVNGPMQIDSVTVNVACLVFNVALMLSRRSPAVLRTERTPVAFNASISALPWCPSMHFSVRLNVDDSSSDMSFAT